MVLIHNFANLKLHKLADRQITRLTKAVKYFRKPSVMLPARAFLRALLLHSGCSLKATHLIIAFGIAQTEVHRETVTPQMEAVIAAAQELVSTVQVVLEQCGTSPAATLESLPQATKLRFKAAAETFVGSQLEFATCCLCIE